MTEEYDPYQQHNECPEIGYIDPPAEPYRYISPIRREINPHNVKSSGVAGLSSNKEISSSASNATSTSGGKRTSPIQPHRSPATMIAASPLGKASKACDSCGRLAPTPKARTCDVGSQTLLTMEQIAALEVGVAPAGACASGAPRSSSAGGSGKRVATSGSSSAAPRRPVEPVRSSSSKKVPSTSSAPAAASTTRTKSANKVVPTVAAPADGAVVAARRSTRMSVAAMGSPSVKTSVASDVGGLTPGSSARTQQLLDVTPTAARRMFSGSGNNGVASGGVTRTHSSSKAGPSSSAPSVSLLKRGQSSERPATIGTPASAVALGGSAGAALQAALARNLLRKQAATNVSTPKTTSLAGPEQFSTQASGTATTGRRHVAEFSALDGSPNRAPHALTASLPASLSSPSTTALSRVGGPGGATGKATPPTSSISALNAPAKFSRGPSASSNSGPSSTIVVATSTQRRVAAAPTSSVAASKRVSTVVGAAPAPARTSSSKVAVRKVNSVGPSSPPFTSPTSSLNPTPLHNTHVDPTADSSVEVRKAQALNQHIVHQQSSLDERERARQWQQAADDKAVAAADAA